MPRTVLPLIIGTVMRRLTEEDIEQRLLDGELPMELIEYGDNVDDNSSRWECHNCGHEWGACADNILRGKGCPYCAGTR